VLIGALALGVRTFPGFGPALANGLRRVIGVNAVAWLEENVAELDDARKRALAPRAPRAVSEVRNPVDASAPSVSPSASAPAVDHRPGDVQPPFRRVAAPGDGEFAPVLDPARPELAPLMYTTMLHPDADRPWAELFVVTVPVAEVELHAVAGTREPSAARKLEYERTGLIRPEHEPKLLAAFNGGFRAEHGRHGMMVDGVEVLPARPGLCTIAGYADGSLRIATWRDEAPWVKSLFWRQTPPCMVEDGRMHPGLRDESVKTWGATLEGSAVSRRSAIGLSADGKRLFVGISNDTTARAIAVGMQRAGASEVAQLDVNWSYPKFLLFPRDRAGRRHAETLFRGFLFRPDDYVTRRSPRDFFYLVRRH
jgi:hypothetical protein